MPLYMTQFSYTPEAWAALVKNPEDREAVFGALLDKLGGKLHHIYYAFGEYDGFAIYEVPDENTAMTTVLTIVTPGHLKATRTTVLFTMAEAMEAMRKAGAQEPYASPKG